MIVLHVGALFAPFTFSWPAFWIFLTLLWLTNGLGITLCYHRLLTHRSFRVPKLLEYFFSFCGALSSQGGAISWVSTHRYHHLTSDTDNDPHTPRHGFWWAHMLWFLYKSPILDSAEFRERWAPDLVKDPVHRFFAKYGWLSQWVVGLSLLAWGGIGYVVWGVFLRSVVALHITWLVNSATHMWGYKLYDAKDDSRNLWWVGLLAFGEGWHNNHHAFQYSAAHGLKWWEFDLTYQTIRLLSFFGLADSIKLPKLAYAESLSLSPKQAPKPLVEKEEELVGV